MQKVKYKGEIIEVSDREYRILYKRGHLRLIYNDISWVIPEGCLELLSTTKGREGIDVLLSTQK